MKRLWKLRCIFIFLCLSVLLYLGFKTNKFTLKLEKYYDICINEVMVNNRNSIRDDEGDFEDWIEIYNKGDTTINLNGFGLSNDTKQPFLWTFPDIRIEPKSFILVWASEKNKKELDSSLHTNFKLKNKDTSLILTSPDNDWNDIFMLQPMEYNISYGRMPDGAPKFYGFDEGTPYTYNISKTLIKGINTNRLESPSFSHDGGFYTEEFNLRLKTNDNNAVIHYTLDGSVPTRESKQYTKPILISSNDITVIRTRSYKEGYPKSEVTTHSYFVQKNIYNEYNTPIISIVTDPDNLFDYEKGIYVHGKVFDQWLNNNPNEEVDQMTPANYNQRGKLWERQASIELFESDGTLGLIQDIGIRIHGGFSRSNKLKSLSLFSRKDYDDKEYFLYDFFDGKSINKINNNVVNQFSRVLLRTSATDSKYALFRDAFVQSLVDASSTLDTQNSKPCILYINGEYYGIHNIREAYDKNYIMTHYNINPDDVVIIKNPTGIAGVEIQEGYVGDEMHYNAMISYVRKNDLKIDNNYDYVNTQIDIDNFIEYNVLQIYCDNRDWPGNNVSIWRKRTETYEPKASYGHDGRWRWMVFDLDYGFGLHYDEKAYENNSLKRATDENGPDWPNPPWSTLLLRSLLENEEFKNQFINVFADKLNRNFMPEIVIDKIEDMEEIYRHNVMNHIIRWDLHDKDIENWLDEVEGIKKFAINRPRYVRQHIIDYFGLEGTSTIKVDMNEGGIVKVNSLDIKYTNIPWTGIYFKDIPITVEAIPEPGFTFIGWEGTNKYQDKRITINLAESIYVKAIFESNNNNYINME